MKENIEESNNNIIQLARSPKEFIKNIIIEDYSNKSKKIFEGDKFKNLEENIYKLIGDIPKNVKNIEQGVKDIEEEYMEKKEQNEINSEIKKIKDGLEKLAKYNQINDENKIQCTDQNFNRDIEYLKKIPEYKDFSDKKYDAIFDKETINYYKIEKVKNKDFKNISVKYEDNVEIEIQNNNENLYLKSKESIEEIKKKLSIKKKETSNINPQNNTNNIGNPGIMAI